MESIAAAGFGRFVLSGQESTLQLRGLFVSGNYFSTLGIPIAVGRGFTEDEMEGRAPLAAVVAHHIWDQHFHRDPHISGREVVINGRPATIVGVTAAGFRGIQFAPNFEIGVPFHRLSEGRLRPGDDSDRSNRWIGIVGRLAPDVSLEAAQAEFDAISKRLDAGYPGSNKGLSVVLSPYTASAFGGWQHSPGARAAMTILGLVSFLVLVVACANVGNLMLARAVARQRETAIRVSIGASHWRVVRRLVAEGLVLSLAAACVAWLFTFAAASAANSLVPPLESGAQLELNVWPDERVAALAFLLALLTSILCTLAGSIRVLRQDPLSSLKAGENASGSGRSRTAQVFVVVQFALCVVLLTAGGLALRSARALDEEDLSFERENLMLASVNTSSATSSRSDHIALLGRIQAALWLLPGVEAVSYATQAPPSGQSAASVAVRTAGGETLRTDLAFTGPAYLAALGVPILAGRDFVDQDTTTAEAVAVINQNLASALWPGQSPLGRPVIVGAGSRSATVVGLVPNGAFSVEGGAGYGGLSRNERGNFIFLMERDGPAKPGPMTLHIRYSHADQALLIAGIRAAVHQVDHRIPVFSVQTMEQRWKSFTGPMRLVAGLFEILAFGALIISSIGLHAVIAFYTARRRKEFALRMALGATPGQTLLAVLKEGLTLTVFGFAFGLPIALALGHVARGLLYGVTPADAVTYAVVVATLSGVSLVACFAPAIRTVRIDPMQTLRQE